MKKNYNRGFTLIELLVVIAIIGILASVVLASLNSARNKGADAAIKSQLANAKAQAEIFYGTGNTYDNGTTGVCNSGSASNGVMDLVAASMKNYNGTTTVGADSTAGTATTAVCHDSATAWAAAVPLKAPAATGGVWCVDSSGFSGEKTTYLAANGTSC